jgi:hypothetical protein
MIMNIGMGGLQTVCTKTNPSCEWLVRIIFGLEQAHALIRNHRTEVAPTAEGLEAVVLSGAWRTWVMVISDFLHDE